MIISQELSEKYPGALLMEKTIEDISRIERSNHELEAEKRKAEEEMRSKFANLDDPRIRAYETYYRGLGIEQSHMKSQIRSILKGKQMPVINTLVDSVLLPELRHCILMGAHDSSFIEGDAVVSVTKEGEEFTAIGNRLTRIPANDIVLRDDKEIIASIAMGPCEKTKLRHDTATAKIFAFLVPEVERKYGEIALQEAEEYINRFCK